MTKITKVDLSTKKGFAKAYAALKILPGTRDAQVLDATLSGFGLRMFKSGKANFFVKYSIGDQQRRMSLGKATVDEDVLEERLEEARKEADKILAQATLGQDAQAEKKAKRDKKTSTVGDLIPKFLGARKDDMAPSYYAATERYLKKNWKPLHGFAVRAIERDHVRRVLDDIEDEHGKVSADRARAALSSFYAWAIDRGPADVTPVLHIRNRANGGGRDRVLSEDELTKIWRAVGGMGHYDAILRLLILTGQRKSEIGDLSWPEIDFERKQIELPSTRTKNRRSHLLPLSDLALNVINEVPQRNSHEFLFGRGGSRGFQGWSRCKARLDEALPADMKPWTVHDIRRSVITHLNERGFADPHVVEALANHVSGHKASVAGVYNRSAYAEQKRAALERWAEHVRALVRS